MKLRILSLTKSVLGLGVGALLCASISVQAVPVSFLIDSSQSSITLGGQAFGLGYNPLAAGGNLAHFSGIINADLTGGVLTFSGGSTITALVNPSAPFTWPPTSAVNGVQNYGVLAQGTVPGYGFAQVYGVYRDVVFDITAGTAQNGAAPAGTVFNFNSGALDYSIYLNGNPYQVNQVSTPLNNGSTVGNTSATLVSLIPGTGVYGDTLMFPVSMITAGSNRAESWNGMIVAVVPEPSTLVLVGFGLLGLVALRNRRSA